MGLGFLILTVIGFLKKLGCGLAPSDEGAVEQSETEGEKGLRFYAVLFLSLRLFAYAKSHLPRQREAISVKIQTLGIKPSYLTSQFSIAYSSRVFISSFLERLVSFESASKSLTVLSLIRIEKVL